MVKTAIGLSSIILLHTKTIFKIIQGIPVILEIQDGMWICRPSDQHKRQSLRWMEHHAIIN